EEERVPVLCYPQRWESVSFYLPRARVKVFAQHQLARLCAELRARPDALLLVKMKSAERMRDFLGMLPESVEFVADRHGGGVARGGVRLRELADETLLAQR